MTLDDMYTEMELYGFDDLEDAQKLILLNESYFDVVTREPWPFLEALSTIVVPSGQEQITNNTLVVPNPTNVNSVLSFIDTSNNIVMTPERVDVIEKAYFLSLDTSISSVYYFLGDELMIYPASSGSTYRLLYTKTPVAATTTSDTFYIPSRHHSIIVYGALVKAFLVNDDPQATVFQNLFEARYQQMRSDLWMNQYDRTDRVFVTTDSMDWSY